jgi:hypothetical protein
MKSLSSSRAYRFISSIATTMLLACPSVALAVSPSVVHELDAEAPPPTSAPEDTASMPIAAPAANGSGALKPSEAEVRRIAAERFERGTRLFEDGDYQLALLEFERAYESTLDYRVLYNIGQVRIQLGRYAGATTALTQYLREGTDGIVPERRATIAADLKMLAERTAQLLVTTNVEGAEVLIDDIAVAQSPMVTGLLVDAGEHRLTVRKPGYLSRTIPVALTGHDQQTVNVPLTAETTVATKERTVIVERLPPLNPAEKPPVSPRTTYLWAGWIGTSLLTGSAIASGLIGHAAYDDRERALGRRTSDSELNRLEIRANRWFLTADILGALALVTAGTTLYFTLTGPGAQENRPILPGPANKAAILPNIGVSQRHVAVTLEGAF